MNLTHTSEAYWVAEGVELDLMIHESSFVYIVGGAFVHESKSPYEQTSSFMGASERSYLLDDALNNRNNASIGHDDHIDDGKTNAKDIVYLSTQHDKVDPPFIAVLNWAPKTSFVNFHTHPFGALYIPFTGTICFRTDEDRCIDAGYARWTSPNLYYYEYFKKPTYHSPQADALIKAAGMTDCDYPIVFGVTNFDASDDAGVPNFDSVPSNAVKDKEWGTFDTLRVMTTSARVDTVRVKGKQAITEDL